MITQKNVTTQTPAQLHDRIRRLSLAGLFAAMITVMTAFICHVPTGINGGYIHFGDSLIYMAAALLPTPYALAAAAIGGGLADLLTAPIWAPATILIKLLVALPFTSKKETIINTRNVLSTILALFITCSGYFLAELIIFGVGKAGFWAALTASVGGNIIQGVGSAAFFIIFGLFLDRIGFKRRLR